jgi:hypothetical protein
MVSAVELPESDSYGGEATESLPEAVKDAARLRTVEGGGKPKGPGPSLTHLS